MQLPEVTSQYIVNLWRLDGQQINLKILSTEWYILQNQKTLYKKMTFV